MRAPPPLTALSAWSAGQTGDDPTDRPVGLHWGCGGVFWWPAGARGVSRAGDRRRRQRLGGPLDGGRRCHLRPADDHLAVLLTAGLERRPVVCLRGGGGAPGGACAS